MTRFFDPSSLARTFRDPVSWAALIVDLIPIYAVLTLGWGAAPLVFLYWLENVIIGVVTVGRMIAVSVQEHIIGIVSVVLMVPFFTVHYGMFCFVHGQFLAMFATSAGATAPPFLGPVDLIEFALRSGPQMLLFASIIAAWQAFLFVYDFILKGQYRGGDIGKEMFSPYPRIMVLHIGLFAGAAALVALGDPMLGVLALILLRVVWGVITSMRRRRRLDQKVDGAS